MDTTCPTCGGQRWMLRHLESRVLHVDVDTSADAPVVERSVEETAYSAIVGAACDACGHEADHELAGRVAQVEADVAADDDEQRHRDGLTGAA